MIVRINQLDPHAAERESGWESGPITGPIDRQLIEPLNVFQVTILDQDEHQQPVPGQQRRDAIRKVLPGVVDAITTDEDRLVLRYDGPLTRGGVTAVFTWLGDSQRTERFSFSHADQLAGVEQPPLVSVRLLPRRQSVTELIDDSRVSLHLTTRLRVFGIHDELVDPLLDTAELDDERWRELLPAMSFLVSPARDMQSVLVWSGRLEASVFRHRVTERFRAGG